MLCGVAGTSPWLALAGLTMAATGVVTALPMFWALPTSFLGGAGAAAGIALINSTGNLAGFVSPSSTSGAISDICTAALFAIFG